MNNEFIKNKIAKEIKESKKEETKEISKLTKTIRRMPILIAKFKPSKNYIKMDKKELNIKILELLRLKKEEILQLLVIRRKDFLENASKETSRQSSIDLFSDSLFFDPQTKRWDDWYQYMILCLTVDGMIRYIEKIEDIKKGLEKNPKIVRFLNTSDLKLIQYDKNKLSFCQKMLSFKIISKISYYIIYPIIDLIYYIISPIDFIIGSIKRLIDKLKESKLSELDVCQLLMNIESDYNQIKSKVTVFGFEKENLMLDELFYPIIKDRLIFKPIKISNITKPQFGFVHFPENKEFRKNSIEYGDHFVFSIQETIRPDKIKIKDSDCLYINSTGYILIGIREKLK